MCNIISNLSMAICILLGSFVLSWRSHFDPHWEAGATSSRPGAGAPMGGITTTT